MEKLNETMVGDAAKGLFYSQVARRPLIDIVTEQVEKDYWEKQFEGSNDLTLYSWRNEWLKNTKENLKHFGYFNRDHSVKIFFNELVKKPIILVGAGPSLAKNIEYLRLAKEKGITIMATHHSLMYLADVEIKPDFVCVLDAGEMWDEYFAFDKMDCSDVPLLTEETCNNGQLKKWKGPIKFFSSTKPEGTNIGKYIKMELGRIIPPNKHGSIIEVGGHAMGAMLSLARGVFQSNTIIFVGCDYCFEGDKFYPFDHKIDKEVDGKYFGKEGEMLPSPPPPQGQIVDIFGRGVATNTGYLGFKNVIDEGVKASKIVSFQQGVNMDFINASEGGALGALVGGNSMYMQYLRLEDAIYMTTEKLKEEK